VNRDRKTLSRRQLLQSTAAFSLLVPGFAVSRVEAESVEKKDVEKSFAWVVKHRGMVRAYKTDPVPEEKIQHLLRYAVRAPSAGNLQPWEFVIVKNPDVRAQLTKAAMNQNAVATAPVTIVTCADIQRMGSEYGARGSFFSLVDTSFATLLILLGAIEQDLGACFVGSYNPEEVAKVLGLPPHVRPVGLITIGYPAEQPQKPKTKKIPLSKLVHTDKW
jgi:nitroreductase